VVVAAPVVAGGGQPVRVSVAQTGLTKAQVVQAGVIDVDKVQAGLVVIEINGRTRIQDIVQDGIVGEVKDVKYLSLSTQIRDSIAIAANRGSQFNLYVDVRTKISKPLQKKVDAGIVHLFRWHF
jgi:hypothetical protein